MTLMLPDPRLFADGFVMVESGRWHDGRLWFAHWGAGEVVAVDLMGQTEVMAPGRTTMGWTIDWLRGRRFAGLRRGSGRHPSGRLNWQVQRAG